MSTSPFEPLRREKLSETVAARLRDEIVEGGLAPGERLPGHRELAEAFSVGLSSIREAISKLSSEGLVEARVGRGTYVRDPGEGLKIGAPGERPPRREAEQVIKAREVLE